MNVSLQKNINLGKLLNLNLKVKIISFFFNFSTNFILRNEETLSWYI